MGNIDSRVLRWREGRYQHAVFYIHSLREDPDGKNKGKGSYLDAFQAANYVLVVVASRKSRGHMDTMRIQYVPP